MKKFGKILMVVLVAALFIGTFAYLFQRSKPKEIQYQEVMPEKGDISKSTVVTGKIQPRDEVNVKPQINGIVAELYKKAGETVQQNEVIAKLKVIPDMSQLSSAQSRLRLAEVNLTQAQTNYKREKELFDKNLVSAEEFEKVSQALEQAKEERSIAQETLEIVRDGVSSSNKSGSTTLVRSTISGLILDIPVKVGNSVTMSNTFNDGTTIATVANMDDLIFDGNIDETEVGRLHVGLPVRITVGALQDVHFDAALEYISPKATESNGTNLFEIKASVKVPSGVTIRSGYSANAEIVLEQAPGVLTLAESAIQWEGDSTFVYVKAAEGWDKRPVETGLSDGVNIEIKSGLSEGETVRGTEIIKAKK
ncbi:MAG: efflux RND transporter periplasmic adaptor subunit [Bacteroidales bacterium]|jgi:HlyD family secretion protein|nr:efflux RND transporter periplasmic adaptor subunit [Bacteroidales bacterium]